jgi:hypothetical protein
MADPPKPFANDPQPKREESTTPPAANKSLQSAEKDSTKQPEDISAPKPTDRVPSIDAGAGTGTRVIGQTADEKTTPQEERARKLRAFMLPPVRKAYDAADFEQKQIIWAANERAFEEAEIRKEQKRQRDQQRMAEALDAFQRAKEDPDQSDRLPPDDASMPEILKWHEDRAKPVPPVSFSALSEQQVRRYRMWRGDPSNVGASRDPDQLPAKGGSETDMVASPPQPITTSKDSQPTINHTKRGNDAIS